MDRYNKHIADELLRRQMAFIHDAPQPTMFGGVRPREFVLPMSTEYDYPSTLAVGRVSGNYPDTLAGTFWGSALEGGLSHRAFDKSLKSAGKKALPIGTRLAEKQGKKALDKFLSGSGMEYDEDEMSSSDEECEEYDEDEEAEMEGGKKKYGVSRFVKDLGKISKAVGAKQFLKPIAQASTKKAVEKIEGAGRRGRPRKMKTAVMSMEDLGMEGGKKKYGVSRFVKDLGKISKAIGLKQFTKPLAQALTKKAVEKIEGAGRRGRPRNGGALLSGEDEGLDGSYPPELSTVYKGGKKKYGVSRFVKDLGKISKAVGAKQFLKPIAEASTKKAVEKIQGAGRGRNARAEIVRKVMKEKGLNLPQASKYVKEHGLY